MNLDNFSRVQKLAFFVSGIALVAGISLLLALSGRGDPVLDTVPQDVVEKSRIQASEFPGDEPGRRGGILVSPSETIIEDISSPIELPPITVTNRSNKAAKIEVDFVPVDRFLLEGVPVVDLNQTSIYEGSRLVTLNQKSFSLDPGQKRDVVARINQIPTSGVLTGSIGVTVLDDKLDFSNSEKNDVRYAIQNNLRINSMLYATAKGAASPRVVLKQLRGFEEDQGLIDFALRVKGEAGIVAPRGDMVVENSLGDVVARRKIDQSQTIVAGSERDIGIDRPVEDLPPGSYEAAATIYVGNSMQKVRWAFQIDRNGQLPTPAAEVVAEARPNFVERSGKFNLFVQVQNTGTKPFAPAGFLRLYQLGQEKVIEEVPIKMKPLAPGDITDIAEQFTAPSEPGNYEILVNLESEDRSFLDQRVVSLLVESDPDSGPGPVVKFRDWLSSNSFAALGLGMILFGIILGLLTITQVRRSNKN